MHNVRTGKADLLERDVKERNVHLFKSRDAQDEDASETPKSMKCPFLKDRIIST